MFCVGCEWQLKPNSNDEQEVQIAIDRYDRIESLYLTTGDPSALQQMNTNYPIQTRMLIEDMLRIGKVNDAEINVKFLHFFQDSILQSMLADVEKQYAEMDDLTDELSSAFQFLKEHLPAIEIPRFYTQIGSFDQSIIVGIGTLGISLDKYLGSSYPFYLDHYTAEQRKLMTREMIVPDCVAFFLLSQYPLSSDVVENREARHHHMGKIQWVVNEAVGRQVFRNGLVAQVSRMMKKNRKLTIAELLSSKKL